MNPVDAPVIWITARRGTHQGRACRDYICSLEDGRALFNARAFVWDRRIECAAADAAAPAIVLKRRLSFPLTGRVDILDREGTRIGAVRRNGSFRDAAGVAGRFRDARSARSYAAEGALAAVAEIALGSEGGSQLSGATGWVLSLAGAPAGELRIARPPWIVERPWTGDPGSRARRWLGSVRAALRPETSWRFTCTARDACDPRVRLGAALFMIELSRW